MPTMDDFKDARFDIVVPFEQNGHKYVLFMTTEKHDDQFQDYRLSVGIKGEARASLDIMNHNVIASKDGNSIPELFEYVATALRKFKGEDENEYVRMTFVSFSNMYHIHIVTHKVWSEWNSFWLDWNAGKYKSKVS